MQTIAQRWHVFETMVMPPEASQTQRREMRRAFYAGFYHALTAFTDMADAAGDNDDIGATMIERMNAECLQFGADVEAGRA